MVIKQVNFALERICIIHQLVIGGEAHAVGTGDSVEYHPDHAVRVQPIESARTIWSSHCAAKDAAHRIGDHVIKAAVSLVWDFFQDGGQFTVLPGLDGPASHEQQ